MINSLGAFASMTMTNRKYYYVEKETLISKKEQKKVKKFFQYLCSRHEPIILDNGDKHYLIELFDEFFPSAEQFGLYSFFRRKYRKGMFSKYEWSITGGLAFSLIVYHE